MTPGRFGRTVRTVWHLRASQVLWRLARTLGRRWPWPRGHRAPDDLLQRGGSARGLPAVPVFHRPGPRGDDLVEQLAEGRFVHLNQARELGCERPDWLLGQPTRDRLWTITLHYHAWAYELAAAAIAGGPRAHQAADLLRHYLGDWIARCDLRRPGARSLAWNSFSVATRLACWIRTFNLMHRAQPAGWAAFEPRMIESLWQQAAYLHGHLEWDLRANHLLRDLSGLAWAGRFFAGDASAARWLETATRLAPGQVAEQILPDGAHFERSPMYHLQAMEDVLNLALLLQDPPTVERLAAAWRAMAEVALWLRHPDGQIPLLNDAAQHAAADPARMLDLAPALGGAPGEWPLPAGGRHFPDAGLVVWHGDPWSVFFDAGALGPDYQPGHGHADTLTFECSYAGLRLFVDPGCFGYDADERRRYDRSTAAHNTVCLDRSDSSEVWDIFRVGRRARPLDVRVEITAGSSFRADATHDGYDHLPGRPRHARTLAVSTAGELSVSDRVTGRRPLVATGGLLVEPSWKVEAADGGWLLRQAGHRLRVSLTGPAGVRLSVERAPYHPRFGVELLAERIGWAYEGPGPLALDLHVGRAPS